MTHAAAVERGSPLLVVAVVLAVAFATFPATPQPVGLLLDANGLLGLNMVRGQGLAFGRDVVFPYGPLSFLGFPDFTCGLLWTPLLFRLAVWSLWVLLALRLARSLSPRFIGAGQAACLGAVGLVDFVMPTERLELAIVGCAAVALRERAVWPAAVLGALAGVAVLTKINLGALASGLLALVVLGGMDALRPAALRLGAGFASALASVLVLDAAICAGTVDLRAYVASLPDVVRAFESTSLDGPRWVLLIPAASLVSLAGIVALAEDRRSLWPAVPAAAWTWFLSYKHAFLRQDAGHAAPLAARLALPAVLLLAAAASTRDRRRLLAYQVAAIVIGAGVAGILHPTFWAEVRPVLSGARSAAAVRDALHWPDTWARLERQGRETIAVHRLSQRYHAVIDGHTVDAQPWQTVQVLANGWTWCPPPMFAAYLVASPGIDARNAAHVVGPRAADIVLLRWEGELDGTHPFLRSPRTWQAYLAAYRVAVFRHNLIVLERRPSVRPPSLVPLPVPARTVAWDEPFPVPAGSGVVVARAAIQRSPYGRLRTFLFRPCPVFLDVRYRDGSTARWRTSGATLQAGFIANHLPRTIEDASAFFEGTSGTGDEVVEMSFHTEGPAQYVAPIAVTWHLLEDGRDGG